ncbi:MAG: glutamine-hydrolyzing carbamoyl-phosphate synthase small subunit [Candidatus Buchananbacteria bacterium]
MTTASLELINGSKYKGISFGFDKNVFGELVFNTGMVGYPEALTDPSYAGQILILTYPLIGNYGVPPKIKEAGLNKYFESEKIQVSGLIVSEYSFYYSHWQAKQSLSQWLKAEKIPALFDIDTRQLTKELRSFGTMSGQIIFGNKKSKFLVRPKPENLVKKVSIQKPIIYQAGKKKIMLLDCGVKNSIIRNLLARNLTVIRVPWDYDFLNTKYQFDGLVLSNGPGDPNDCDLLIGRLKQFLKLKKPILGICLGNQILALAAGGSTYKLKYGHRCQNQPCLNLLNQRCYITSQNHGYAIKSGSLSKPWLTWLINANDKTIEGIKHKDNPFLGVQFHPEANPGPTDTNFIFDDFLNLLK